MEFLWRYFESLTQNAFFMYGYQMPLWNPEDHLGPQEEGDWNAALAELTAQEP